MSQQTVPTSSVAESAAKPSVVFSFHPADLVGKIMGADAWRTLDLAADYDRDDAGNPAVVEDFRDPENAERVARADYIITGWGAERLVDVSVLDAMPHLKAIFAASGAADRIFTDDEAKQMAKTRGIALSNSGYLNGLPVAEYCFANILLANKQFFRAERMYHEQRGWGAWVDVQSVFANVGNYEKTVGLVCASSRIGRRLMTMLQMTRLDVLAYAIDMSADETASYGAVKADLDMVMSQSDIVSLHAPDIPPLRGMIGARELALMKDGATLLNSARGRVVDHDALIAELQTGRINAILDVTWPEPLPSDSPLWDMPNVILTPHIAGSTGSELHAMGLNVAEELARHVAGKPLKYREEY
ncbi:2-hydroxyacid dehydrogenase [Bifidobacterium ramosum]|uniref:Hydroxyacid dehydrogenase n=1 Tax=Bifidobacterium ramosum TaxID=1798158 RepID=A0A6L4WY49_9BIFI|nr:hydroxyacid dehydrogenase [Bifidobacterium ramosum]KAB8286978.1 2-hydroxyacid dehydrogenase [Bifidobacterium ramosum]NEG72514.1 hydroxyacid dehydrogenase [Bifidobacterium ramosum]